MRTLILAAPAPLEQATGGYAYDRRIVEHLREAGWNVEIAELPPGFPAPNAAELAATERWLESLDPAVPVVIDGLAFGALGHIAPAFRERLRLVALVHHPLADETGLDQATRERLRDGEMLALRAARGVVVTSPFTAHRLDAFGVPPGRIRVVEPGVDPRPLARGSGGVPTLLCVASYTRRKGHDVLLAALDRLRDRHWRLICAGVRGLDPAFEAEVETLARSFGDRVELRARQSDTTLQALYATADLFTLASHYEGYGMVFAEAIAAGLPIVATAGGASRDTIPHAAARLVGPGDVTALAEALGDLLDRPERRRELAREARRARGRQRGWPEAAGDFADAIREMATWD
ncbi:MAG: glycosyltransferase [Alphaproteobacteria bacterium]|jgi:glycosyltransferase involved in cell wall biosynthesis|nr:glycosyltransferase [Alphaproteobacteria bacterium]